MLEGIRGRPDTLPARDTRYGHWCGACAEGAEGAAANRRCCQGDGQHYANGERAPDAPSRLHG